MIIRKLKWGNEPDAMLREYSPIIPKGKTLDLGMGEGRNSIFLAKAGFEVEGIDILQEDVGRCLEIAKQEGVKVKAIVGDFRNIDIPKNKYALIVCAWSLNFLKKSESQEIFSKIKKGIKRGGSIYIGVLSTDDPGCKRLKSTLEELEENTFFLQS